MNQKPNHLNHHWQWFITFINHILEGQNYARICIQNTHTVNLFKILSCAFHELPHWVCTDLQSCLIKWHKTWLQMYFWHNGAPISVDPWQKYPNGQIPAWWIDRHGPQNWPLWSLDLTHPRFPCIQLHEIYGVWTQSEQKRETTSLNFQWCKTYEWPWCLMQGSNYLEFQVSVAPQPLRNGPMLIFLTGNDLRNKIQKHLTFSHQIPWITTK
jgi:hypothetical protein